MGEPCGMPRRLSRASVVRVDAARATGVTRLQRCHSRCGLHTRTVTVCRDRYPKASDTSSPPCLLRSLPAGAVTGWGLHPLEKRRLVTAHVERQALCQAPIPAHVSAPQLEDSHRRSSMPKPYYVSGMRDPIVHPVLSLISS